MPTPIEQSHAVAVQLRSEIAATASRLNEMSRGDLEAKLADLGVVAANLCEWLRQVAEAEPTTEETK